MKFHTNGAGGGGGDWQNHENMEKGVKNHACNGRQTNVASEKTGIGTLARALEPYSNRGFGYGPYPQANPYYTADMASDFSRHLEPVSSRRQKPYPSLTPPPKCGTIDPGSQVSRRQIPRTAWDTAMGSILTRRPSKSRESRPRRPRCSAVDPEGGRR